MANSIFGVDVQAEGAAAVREAIASEVKQAVTRTIKDVIEAAMVESGTQEASAFEVTVNGVTRTVVSDADPALRIEVQPTDQVRVAKINSADAGR